MEINEIDYDDTTLDVATSIDDVIDTGKPVDPAPVPVNSEPEPEPKKTRGRPKATPAEPVVEPDPTPEPEPEPDDVIEENVIQSIAKKIGIELGEDDNYEDSEDGLVAFTQRAAEDIADQKLNSYFENLPPIAGDFFDYLQMLGEEATEDKIKSFFTTVNPEINYSEVDLENESVQKAVLKSFYKKNDFTDEEIAKKLDKFEVAGMLKEEAEEAANKLSKLQAKERETLLKQEKAEADNRKANTQKFFGTIKQVLESGKVNNFTIPVTEKKAIFDYDVQGNFMKDLNEILKDPTKRTELNIWVKNKGNLNKYIQAAAATQKANTLSAKIKASVGTGKGTANPNLVSNTGIDWDNLKI